jgi:hypothetical protein
MVIGCKAGAPRRSAFTGKYRRSDLEGGPGGGSGQSSRKDVAAGNGFLTVRGLDIAIGLPSTIPGRLILEWAAAAERARFSTLGIIDRIVSGPRIRRRPQHRSPSWSRR